MDVEKYLEELGASAVLMDSNELRQVIKGWLKAYSADVFAKTGKWIYNDYKWHAFSFNFTKSEIGMKARESYLGSNIVDYYIFDDDETWGYRCKGGGHPIFEGEDVYVLSSDYSWTIAFTHEEPGIGPFYSRSRDA